MSSETAISCPAKTCRDESSDEYVVVHGSVYYANGDIVLLSLPTKANIVTAFKVDKIFLSRYSPVFEGMLSIPPPDSVEKYDQVPLVRLQDKADDLASFLTAIYNPMTFPCEKHHPDTISKVRGMLQLSKKYQVDCLHKRIGIAIVTADWPSKLSSWDSNEIEIEHKKKEHGVGVIEDEDDIYDAGVVVLPDPCEAIRFARDHDIKSILPAAFYQLSRMPSEADPDDRNADVETHSYHRVHVRWEGHTARFSLLSSQDFLCLLRGIRSMERATLECFKISRDKAASNCTSRTPACRRTCEGVLHQLILDVGKKPSHAPDSVYAPADPLETFLCKDLGNSPACQACVEAFSSELRPQRSELWDKLPAIFRLDTQ